MSTRSCPGGEPTSSCLAATTFTFVNIRASVSRRVYNGLAQVQRSTTAIANDADGERRLWHVSPLLAMVRLRVQLVVLGEFMR